MSQQTGGTDKPDQWAVSWEGARVLVSQGGKDWGKRQAQDSPRQFGETDWITCRKGGGSDAALMLCPALQSGPAPAPLASPCCTEPVWPQVGSKGSACRCSSC